MNSATSYDHVLEAIMAGRTAVEVIPDFQKLVGFDQQTILCTVCSIRNEILSNSRDHGNEVFKLLTSECPFFVNSRPTCRETHKFVSSFKGT